MICDYSSWLAFMVAMLRISHGCLSFEDCERDEYGRLRSTFRHNSLSQTHRAEENQRASKWSGQERSGHTKYLPNDEIAGHGFMKLC